MSQASVTGLRPIRTGTNEWELFMLRLRYRASRQISLAGNHTILLEDPALTWMVYAGAADIFVVEMLDNREVGTRHHLFTVPPGQVVFGLASPVYCSRLLMTGLLGTQVLGIPHDVLLATAREPEHTQLVSELLENWLISISAQVIIDLPPRQFTLIEAGKTLEVKPDTVVRTGGGEVLWVEQVEGTSSFANHSIIKRHTSCPLPPNMWLQTEAKSTLAAISTQQALQDKHFPQQLDNFHEIMLARLDSRLIEAHIAGRQQIQQQQETDHRHMKTSLVQLASVLQPAEATPRGVAVGEDQLLAACRLVGKEVGINIQKPLWHFAANDPLHEIAHASHFRIRKVSLKGKWWKSDGFPLLGFLATEERPIALLPDQRGYTLHDPLNGTSTQVTGKTTSTLANEAYMFYRPLPTRRLSLWDILQFSFKGNWENLKTLLLMTAAVGIISLGIPIFTEVLFDYIIPGGQRSSLLYVGLALLVGALATAVFTIVRGIALLRLEINVDQLFQAALFDRLLSLPTSFFHQYTAGDLGERVMSFTLMRQILSRIALSALLSLVSSAFSIILLFIYSTRLAWVVVGLTILLFIVMSLSSYLQVRYYRRAVNQEGQISGLILQFINGIAKLRVAGAERRAFARWAACFAEQRQFMAKMRGVDAGLITLNEAFSLLSVMSLFAIASMSQSGSSFPSTGSFLAFIAAFTQFFWSALNIGTMMSSVVAVVPLYERLRPILETPPEVTDHRAHPGELRGRIEISHVSFWYHEEAPPILNDISIQVEPGQFVALVGPSGAGKSTLFRLLLGFEQPGSGAIFFDGQDLTEIDVQAVRRQIGVVLQNSKLMVGDIFSNIVGSRPLTLDDAWLAAEMAGVAEDIREMPMGMHTLVGEGIGTLSGGQRQRILIARAIVNRPRLILFDEATSAMDNRTQDIICKSLEQLDTTRVVIAHRLSTIQNADQIYVLEKGRIVQQGTYGELIVRRGPFADLAKRQLA